MYIHTKYSNVYHLKMIQILFRVNIIICLYDVCTLYTFDSGYPTNPFGHRGQSEISTRNYVSPVAGR